MRRALAFLCAGVLMACGGGSESFVPTSSRTPPEATPGTTTTAGAPSGNLPPGSAPSPDAGASAADDDAPVAAEDARVELTFTGDDASYDGDREITEGRVDIVLINDSSEPVWFVVQYFERGSAVLQADLDRYPEGTDFVTVEDPAGELVILEQHAPGLATEALELRPGTYFVEVGLAGAASTHVWRAAVIDVVAGTEDLDVASDPVVDGDVTIPVFNGAPALNRLLAWGVGRFQVAGLELPEISAVTFTIHSDFCDGAWGQTQATARGYELWFCFDEARACWDEDCTHLAPAGRLAVLHELAHAWMYANLDDRVQRQFADHVGLTNWNDSTVAWDRRAIEHAADTIAWGLMDREMRMLPIGDPGRADLTAGFRILTDADPLPRTDDYSSTDLPVALE